MIRLCCLFLMALLLASCGSAPEKSAKIEDIAPEFAKNVLQSKTPVLVDFWAPWCGPCRMMAPAYEQAAAQLAPGVRLAKLNTEDVPDVATRFGIRGIPTLIAFKNGREVARQSGAMDVNGLIGWVRSHV